jgi:hypothetical protein
MLKVIGRTLFGFSIALCSGSCVVPPRDGLAQVRVDDVMKLIKCEMARAVFAKTREHSEDGKDYPFTFLLQWAVKLHLTVSVDDQASINPGATLISPLPAVGSVGQQRSVGLGVGFQSQAVRQEDYEYLLSFKELQKEFSDVPKVEALYNSCRLDQGLLLESELGLKALIDAALAPVKSGVLRAGSGNFGPGAGPTPQGKLPPPADQLKAIQAKRDAITIKNLTPGAPPPVGNEATDIETETQAIINNVVKPLYALASASSFDPKCLAGITVDQSKAIVASIGVSINVPKFTQTGDSKTLVLIKKDFTDTVDSANRMIVGYRACAVALGKQDNKSYDPINLISQTVNFYITSSGSVTPSWKLINVTAPLAGSFLSATRKDTNTLILAMGRPIPAANGTISASDAMNNQILASLLGQAISSQRIIP